MGIETGEVPSEHQKVFPSLKRRVTEQVQRLPREDAVSLLGDTQKHSGCDPG